MQSKVSMVVPCYNKVEHIGAMLESVIAQEWDNIELILVNDGSTDGTREKISEYEPKLKARGYEVNVVDQGNAGCCAAVYAGLLRMSGDYFCLVDCDDTIEPKYVSRMAGWLDAYDDCAWAACTFRSIVYSDTRTKVRPPKEAKFRLDTENLLEKHIFRTVLPVAWLYMVRMSYIKECKLIENFCTERRKTYEPLIVTPLAFGKGKLEFFNEPLYLFNYDAMGLSEFKTFEQCVKFYTDYAYLYNWSIDRLAASDGEKQSLRATVRLGYFKDVSKFLAKLPNSKDYMPDVVQGLTEAINEIFKLNPTIGIKKIDEIGVSRILDAIEEKVIVGQLYNTCIGEIILRE